ncbi:PP2C family protein-serine/threonine phosphatase [Aporhodopirellula aestuarii]|uniref:Protein phosphatase 2C domain-containing protein n=1 Tax=Aporhodopirellula aestuarii TaxID=2950107 RepID=A0ABT0UB08_9BACT|nr:protein phosphatase 2C domain-containing protein [Aporhodopirellula aestuarii]MCM2373511.1 protein phosphatase 2C domain-containing protein [Aporhodopirellula aestuarii]
MNVSELTHVGMRRANNQDSHAVMIAESAERFERRGHLFVVADGMGAHAAGELASKIACEQIAMRYVSSQKPDKGQALGQAVHQANTAIYDRGQSNPEFHNMGTTASALVLAQGRGYVAQVGDSRIYRLRKGVLEQLTFDHSLVWEMHASGQIPSDSPLGKSIPKNVITRSLGPGAHVMVDLEGPFHVEIGDRFLLCSDGLTGLVEDDDLGVLMDSLPLEKLAPVLVDLANLRGGPDNITVVIVDVTGEHLVDRSKSSPAGAGESGFKWSSVHSSRALLAVTTICWLGAAGFSAAAYWGGSKWLGSAIAAFILGAIALAVWASGILATDDRRRPLNARRRGKGASPSPVQGSYDSGLEESVIAVGTGPYRRYTVDQHQTVCARLAGVVSEIRRSSEQNHWMLDWQGVQTLQDQCNQAQAAGDWKLAIGCQCDAVLAAMALLRKQQDDSASDTAVDL